MISSIMEETGKRNPPPIFGHFYQRSDTRAQRKIDDAFDFPHSL